MKKITLLTFLLLLNLTYSQEVLNETFDSAASLPAGWTNTNTSGSAELWTFSDNTDFLYLWTAGNGFFNQFSGNQNFFHKYLKLLIKIEYLSRIHYIILIDTSFNHFHNRNIIAMLF